MADVSVRLLGREQSTNISAAARSLVEGRRVLVTGAAGSIGSELVRQLDALGAEVHLLDHDESRLHSIHLELTGSGLLDGETLVLADIRDRRRLHRVFSEIAPDLVFHAAAHKHLQLLEHAPAEAVKTNVYGTQNVVDAALAAGVERLVLISTDKAAEPSSVLGGSKLLAEYVTQGVAHHGMRVASVRFGNVLGSRGSLLDTLRWQLANRLPVTVTHPDVTRFFMSIPEAMGLVLEAAILADCGETYVLDMGEPIRIVDIVERFAELTGHPVTSFVFSGLRPGEKLHEVLAGSGESQFRTGHPRISVIPSILTGSRIDTLHWYYLLNPTWPVAAAVTVYLLTMGWVNRRSFDSALLVMPLYLLFISLVIVPLGVWTYARMAWADRKLGLIRRSRGPLLPAGFRATIDPTAGPWPRPG